MKKIIIIPARMQSVRFPGKVVYPIHGLPMVVRTARQAAQVSDCKIYVATDNVRVMEVCEQFQVPCIETGIHRNGTERCAEAAKILNLADDDMVLNLQADLPFVPPDLLEQIFKLVPYYITTAAVETKGIPSLDPNMVKVVIDRNQNALYFSRQSIPTYASTWYNHIGVYGFLNKLLQEYVATSITVLEQQEKLEQLRILHQAKHRLKVLITKTDCISINAPEDLEKLKIYWPEGQVNGHVI